jgi:acetyl-CoA carboxylase biotin carboxyl carrier protein
MTGDFNDKNLLKNLLKAVKELTRVLKKTDLTKNFQDSNNLEKFSSKRIQIKHDNAITSPMVGTVYLSPEPKAKAFIKQGQTIKKGDTLLIIEAMKTFNPIKSEKSGKIEKILVNDAEPVEFGQPLVVIK